MPEKEKTKNTIEMLKNNKAPGEDIIGTELLKKRRELFV